MFTVVDGNFLAHRTWHTPPVSGKLHADEEFTYLLFIQSFCSALLNITKRIDMYRPAFQKTIVCWDGAKSTELRRAVYPEYKQNRKKEATFNDGRVGLPVKFLIRLRDDLNSVNPRFGVKFDEAEGDDLLAIWAIIFDDEEVCLVTRDQDMYQLVDHKCRVLDIVANRLVGPTEVEELFGVPPDLVVPMKSLMGDSSDGYPGLKGVGPKKALKMLQEDPSSFTRPDLEVYRQLATIPFPALDTDKILAGLAELDLDKECEWENISGKYQFHDHLLNKIQMVV